MTARNAQKLVAFAFGVVFVVVLLVIAIKFPTPTPFQYEVFKVTLALATAGVVAMIPGFLTVKVGNAIRAGGAVAAFVLVYFYSPAGLVSTVTPLKEHSGFLSNLQDHFQRRVPTGDYRLIVASRPDVDVGRFWIDETTDEQWKGFFQKVCDRYASCMKCAITEKAAEITFPGKLVEGVTAEGAKKLACEGRPPGFLGQP